MALKKDLIKKLVDEYGYLKEDIATLTNAKLQKLIDEEEKDAKELEVVKEDKGTTKKVKKFELDDEIAIMNGTVGALTHRSGYNGRSWKLEEFGNIDTMPYRELLAIQNSVSKMIKEGTIIILDEDVQEIFGLKELYKNILTPENINTVFEKPFDEMKEFIEKLPEAMKQTFVQKASQLFAQNKIHDLRIIRVIEEKFKISLQDNAPLDDEPLKYDKFGQ